MKKLIILTLGMLPLMGFGQGCEFDYNEDGIVGTSDLIEFLQYFDNEVECSVIDFFNAPNYYNTIYGQSSLTPTPYPDSTYTYNVMALKKGGGINLKLNTCINVNFIVMTGTLNTSSNIGSSISCGDCVGGAPAKMYVHTPILGNNTFPQWNVGPNNGWNITNIEFISEPCE